MGDRIHDERTSRADPEPTSDTSEELTEEQRKKRRERADIERAEAEGMVTERAKVSRVEP